MSDAFIPLDLTAVFNAGSGNAAAEDGQLWPHRGDDTDNTPLRGLPLGDCLFWGIPFQLAATDAGQTFAVVARQTDTAPASLSIPVGQNARRLLFAHACAPMAGEWATVEGTGQAIGTYRIVFADGTQIEQPLKRRFEIHDINAPWGHHPFLCRNYTTFGSVPLGDTRGGWGRVQTGVHSEFERDGEKIWGNDLQAWWIYGWENPHPDQTIERIEIEAASATPLVLGAITLANEAADPLAWPPREEVALGLDTDADIEVSMERGTIARQDQLVEPDADFLTTDEAGWGRGGQTVRDGRYLEVHGSPEGQLHIKAGDDIDEHVRWGDVLENKAVQANKVRVELVSPQGKQWVHVRVEDKDTGKATGSRVHFRSPQGAYFAPHGHQEDVNTAWFEDMGGDCKVNGVPYAYIDGTCQIELPVGPVVVEVVRGFEYAPLRQQVHIKPGQRHLTLNMERAFDMKAEGYYSGDTHVHFLSAQSSHLEAAAEDLNFVHLLASKWGRLYTSWEEFSGGLSPTSSEFHKIWVSQENRQHVLGHISLLGLKDLIAPMCTGGPQEDWVGGEVQTLMADWAEACRAQGGLVIMPHMPLPDFENAANIVLGQADAAEMCWVWQGEQIGQGEKGYYRWLNVGQKLPIVGGTDKMSNNRILGGSRTYAQLRPDEEFNFETWSEAVKRGRTFASTGAMIDLRADGHHMGDEIALSGNGGTVEVVATARSVWPLTAIELIVNGQEIAREYADGNNEVTIKYKLKTEVSCWVAARCWGPHYTDAGPVMAHSSPIYLDVGRRCAFEPTEGNYLLTHMEGGIAWAEQIGVFRDEAVRGRLIGLFRQAQEELIRRMD
ncbi:MAG: hypothetical protein GKR89_05240 [Candidatus Latescibacteria bacterium]|nr:hypothetical protein [Candidatus Latescibacterota bacterium]